VALCAGTHAAKAAVAYAALHCQAQRAGLGALCGSALQRDCGKATSWVGWRLHQQAQRCARRRYGPAPWQRQHRITRCVQRVTHGCDGWCAVRPQGCEAALTAEVGYCARHLGGTWAAR
jgi:hypothetical protein